MTAAEAANPTLVDLFGRHAVQTAIDRLRAYEPPDGYWLAFSGGKDSVVVHDLAERAGVRFVAHYGVTTVDPPELLRFMKRHYPALVWDRPRGSMFKLMLEHGVPRRASRWCCQEFKERWGVGLVLTGIRWAESQRRRARSMVEGCMHDPRKSFLHPIIDWTNEQVWAYIRERRLPYCSLYDEGWKRLGCVLCPFEYRRAEQAERWPLIVKSYRRAFARFWQAASHRPSFRRWKDAEDMFQWWIHDEPAPREEPGQGRLFE